MVSITIPCLSNTCAAGFRSEVYNRFGRSYTRVSLERRPRGDNVDSQVPLLEWGRKPALLPMYLSSLMTSSELLKSVLMHNNFSRCLISLEMPSSTRSFADRCRGPFLARSLMRSAANSFCHRMTMRRTSRPHISAQLVCDLAIRGYITPPTLFRLDRHSDSPHSSLSDFFLAEQRLT